MIKLKDWQKSDESMVRWKQLMADPLAKQAMEVARGHVLPTQLVTASDNGDTIRTVGALEQARQAGWHGAITFIEEVLTSPPLAPKEQLKPRTLTNA